MGKLEYVPEHQTGHIPLTGRFVMLEVLQIGGKYGRGVMNHQHIFSIEMGGRIAEVKRAGHDGVAINQHHFVVGNQVAGIDKYRNIGRVTSPQCRCGMAGVSAGAVIFFHQVGSVEDDHHVHTAPMGGDQRLDDGAAGEAVGFNIHRLVCMVDD